MEPLSLLRLSSPKRPHPHNDGYGSQSECGSAFSTPYTSAPSSPRRFFFFREDVEEAPLGEVRAAIPFLWEEVPGTPRRGQVVSFVEPVREEYRAQPLREDYSFEFLAGARQIEAAEDGSEDASGEVSLDSESDSEFEFTTRFAGAAGAEAKDNSTLTTNTTTPHCMSAADELFFKGRVLPLRLPPRLQSPKRILQTSDSSCSDSSSGSLNLGSAATLSGLQSPNSSGGRSPKSRLLIFFGCGQMEETADVETLMLGMEKSAAGHRERNGHERRRTGSLSPMRLFKNPGNFMSDETSHAILDFSFTDSSSSSALKSSYEGLEDPWPQFKEKAGRQGKFLDLLDHPDRTNVMSPKKKLGISLLASPERLHSLPRIAEIDNSSVMKHQVSASSSFKGTERSDSRQRTSSRYPLLPRKLKSSSLRSAVSPNLHVKSIAIHQIWRTLFGGCLGSTPTLEEQDFADIYKSPSRGLRSQKVL